MLKGVIFDLDGTLIDCLELHYKAFKKVFWEDYSIKYPRTHLEKHYGKTAEDIIRLFIVKQHISGINYRDFVSKRRKTLVDSLEEKIPLLPGAGGLLEDLMENGVLLGLATGNTSEAGRALLKAAGIHDFFDALVFREDVTRGKPDPMMFQIACEKLGLNTDCAVVVEDSVHGIISAKKAKARCIGVTTGTQSKGTLLEAGPDYIVETLEELDTAFLRNLF